MCVCVSILKPGFIVNLVNQITAKKKKKKYFANDNDNKMIMFWKVAMKLTRILNMKLQNVIDISIRWMFSEEE